MATRLISPYYRLEHTPVNAGTFFAIPLPELGPATAAEDATAAGRAAAAERAAAAKGTAGGAVGGLASRAAGGAAGGLAGKLAKDATIGAVLADLVSGNGLKYSAIWVGLMALGLILVVMGLSKNGVKAPVPIVVTG